MASKVDYFKYFNEDNKTQLDLKIGDTVAYADRYSKLVRIGKILDVHTYLLDNDVSIRKYLLLCDDDMLLRIRGLACNTQLLSGELAEALYK